MAHSRDRPHRDDRRRRSQSPIRHGPKSHRSRTRSPQLKSIRLPLGARPLRKHDLDACRPLLALYLDLQKQLDIGELGHDEVKGRWKSFLGKWNRGELSEGYYDPATKQKADTAQIAPPREPPRHARPTNAAPVEAQSDDEDDYGPALPQTAGAQARLGPGVPSLQDLQQRDELNKEDVEAQREDARYARKQERKEQKQRLEELVPRAEPGSRERQLEKKQERTAANRSFREARSPGAEEVGEGELLGDAGLDGYKAQLKASEKKRSERELRKEEVLRARAAEREERLAEHRAKEDKTMEMLKAIAKQRFG